jgi:alpha-1,2-mannosyltransferase
LKINDATTFICDAPFSQILEYLSKASISVNGMWNEHFGIGNVEALAAGVIPVVHKSGGPFLDIVVPYEGKEIGFHAETDEEYAAAFTKVEQMSEEDRLAMRVRDRSSVRRFDEETFAGKWNEQMVELVSMMNQRHA